MILKVKDLDGKTQRYIISLMMYEQLLNCNFIDELMFFKTVICTPKELKEGAELTTLFNRHITCTEY